MCSTKSFSTVLLVIFALTHLFSASALKREQSNDNFKNTNSESKNNIVEEKVSEKKIEPIDAVFRGRSPCPNGMIRIYRNCYSVNDD